MSSPRPSPVNPAACGPFALRTLTVTAVTLLAFVTASWTGEPVAAAPPALVQGFSSEIVHVKFREGTDVTWPEQVVAQLPPDVVNLSSAVNTLFVLPRQTLNDLRARGRRRSGRMPPDLNLWFQITLQPGTDADAFLEALRRLPIVETAEPAPLPAPHPAVTPDFTANQGYLDAAPGGIGAEFAWTFPGGNGSGIKIYDVEYSWNRNHEDLAVTHGASLLVNLGDTAIDPFNDNNHGTAVLGELVATNDNKGVTGISWGAAAGLAPANTANLGYNPANAVLLAVADGSPGDVILLEQQFPVCGLGAFGPIEVLPSVFDAIRVAVANGFVVVEAAGNGNVNLDQGICGTTFNRTVRDSGAIIVGAGRPPASGFERQRESFSTYGSRIDLQGWGTSVTTTGYGALYTNPDSPSDRNFWYTAFFNGTSSASPIVAGAVANLQGIALQRFGAPLTPAQIRTLLVDTGSLQLGNLAEHIGPRPDLRQAIAALPEATVDVSLDVKPGSEKNPINPRSRGVTPVAILTTDTFDVRSIDLATLRFGARGVEAAPVHSAFEDVDGDADVDLILHFSTQDAGFTCGDSVALLTGSTLSGQAIAGSDQIVTVGCR